MSSVSASSVRQPSSTLLLGIGLLGLVGFTRGRLSGLSAAAMGAPA